MAIKVISTSDKGYQEQEIREFVKVLEEAYVLLDTLAQIQAVTASAMMQSKASKTWEAQAKLGLYVGQLRYSADTKIFDS